MKYSYVDFLYIITMQNLKMIMWAQYISAEYAYDLCKKSSWSLIIILHIGVPNIFYHFILSPVCSVCPKIVVFISALKNTGSLDWNLVPKICKWTCITTTQLWLSLFNISLYRWFMSAADLFHLRRTEFEDSSNCI